MAVLASTPEYIKAYHKFSYAWCLSGAILNFYRSFFVGTVG